MADQFWLNERFEEINELLQILHCEGIEIDKISEQDLKELNSTIHMNEKVKSLKQIEEKLFCYLINQHCTTYVSSSESDFYFNSSAGRTLLQKFSNHLARQPFSSGDSSPTFEALYFEKVQRIYELLSIQCYSDHFSENLSDSINLKVLQKILSVANHQLKEFEEILQKLFDIKLIIFLRAYMKVTNQKNSFFRDQLNSERCYKIKVTRAYVERTEVPAGVYRDKVFTFGFDGQSEFNDRSDSMILIGTSPFCNIVLPDDSKSKLKEISVIIYLNDDQVFIQDLRVEGCSYIKLNYLDEDLMEIPENQKMCRVDEGTIVNLCRKYDFFIKTISFLENLQSSLIIEWLDGPYQGKQNSLKTSEHNSYFKNHFLLGRGGNGVNPDIYCLSCTSEIARDHLRFYYQDAQWFIEDRNSKNFTFIGIKNMKNIEENRPSEPVSLFLTCIEEEKNRKFEARASFLIEKTFMFFFMSHK